MDKRPTRSKMMATTPTEPAIAAAAVLKLKRANRKTEDTHPTALPSLGADHPQNHPVPLLLQKLSQLWASIPCLYFEPLFAASVSMANLHGPTHTNLHIWAKKTPSPKSSLFLYRSSPSLTHLSTSLGVVPSIRVVLFSAERDREEKQRRFEGDFYTEAIY